MKTHVDRLPTPPQSGLSRPLPIEGAKEALGSPRKEAREAPQRWSLFLLDGRVWEDPQAGAYWLENHQI